MLSRTSRGLLVIAVAIIAVAIGSLIYMTPHKSNAARPRVSSASLTSPTAAASDLTCPPTELKITGVFEECAAVDRGQLCLPLSLIHISEPTRLGMISYAVFCLKK